MNKHVKSVNRTKHWEILTKCGWRSRSRKASEEKTFSCTCRTTGLQRWTKTQASVPINRKRQSTPSSFSFWGVSDLGTIPVEFWNFGVVFKQRWSLNTWLPLWVSITWTSPRFLRRKNLLCLPLKSPLCSSSRGFLGWERGCLVPLLCWGTLTQRLVFPFGGLCLLHWSPKARESRDALVHEDRPQSEAWLPTELLPSLQRSLRPICQATV